MALLVTKRRQLRWVALLVTKRRQLRWVALLVTKRRQLRWVALLVTKRRQLRWVALLVALLLGFGCRDQSSSGTIEARLYDVPVSCAADQDSCVAATGGQTAPTETAQSSAFISGKTSRFAPKGLYLYFELVRPDQSVAQVEIDVIVERGSYRVPEGGALSYTEYLGDQVIFRSTTSAAYFVLPTSLSAPDHAPCDCEDGLFELVFSAPGPDGCLGTADDQQRRLSRGRFGLHGGSFCRSPQLLEVIPERVEVKSAADCIMPKSTPRPDEPAIVGSEIADSEVEVAVGCSAEQEPPDEEYGCGGEDVGSSDELEESGCEGDTLEGPETEAGCSDVEDSGDYGAGCEGAGDGDASACEGDAYAARSSAPRRSRSGPGGMLLPFTLLAVLQRALRRRRAPRRALRVPRRAA